MGGVVAFHEEAKVAILATWQTSMTLHETHWQCMDIVCGSWKMPFMERKFTAFHGKNKAHIYCSRPVLDPFLSRAHS